MTGSDILKHRLHNSGLINSFFQSPADIVSHLGAVQAQDYAAAKWALGVRIKNSSDVQIESAFNQGEILRTHVLRPTWHFVMPEDIGWMLELTAPMVKGRMKSYNQKLELDSILFSKANKAIIKTLKQKQFVTRQELKDVLIKVGIKTDVQRLAHIVMNAELDGLICSGPRQRKQFTYALLNERVAVKNRVSREVALSKLATLYFSSHGPAQLKDFSWWSGLKANDAGEALSLIKAKLEKSTVDGKEYWHTPVNKTPRIKSPLVRLISIYDEYTIAYKDRGILSELRDIDRMLKMGSLLTAVIILDGVVAGTWKRSLKKNKVEIELNLFRKFNLDQREALKNEVERYKKFALQE